ncbi:MAG: pilus assembly protein PilP [Deltaproteobacteria bacterium]|nr:pilus assembly protein PilP [Deltaproteobacteria bacterium]
MKKLFPHMLRRSIPGLLIGIVCFASVGCLETQQELVLNPDGSGKLTAQYILGEKLTGTMEESEASPKPATAQTPSERDLPLTAEALGKQFQGESIEIESSLFEKKDGRYHISYTIAFKSLVEFLSTKALKPIEVSFYKDVTTNSLAFHMGIKPFLKRVVSDPDLLEGLKANVTVTFPTKVLETNADSREAERLTWNYTREKLEPEEMDARCEGSGLTFLATLPAFAKKVVTAEYVYDPTGKPDPFRPFILEISRPKETFTKPLHPLQQYDISQLKLVAIVWKSSNPRALLEDAAGKGFIVTEGTYVGKNDGTITDITTKEVIITEKAMNIFGETKITKIRLSLQEEERGKK